MIYEMMIDYIQVKNVFCFKLFDEVRSKFFAQI